MLDIEMTHPLYTVASAYAFLGEKYRARAFERAAYALDGFGHFIDEHFDSISSGGLHGVGPSILAALEEIRSDSRLSLAEEKARQVPALIAELSRVPGASGRLLRKLHEQGVTSRERLAELLQENQLGLSEAVRFQLLQYLERSDPAHAHFWGVPFPIALQVASELTDDMPELGLVLCGEARMFCERVTELVFVSAAKDTGQVCTRMAGHRLVFPGMRIEKHSLKGMVYPGIHCVVHVVPKPLRAFSELFYCSPESHFSDLEKTACAVGFALTSQGLFKGKKNSALNLTSQEEIYGMLELRPVPPELRHYPLDEAQHLAATLVSPSSLRGDFHAHTRWSDGIDSIEAMSSGAQNLGYAYLGIADHSQHLRFAHGLSSGELLRQIEVLKGMESSSVRLLSSSEVEILHDGELDFPSDVLERLDVVVAGIHSFTKMSSEDMTARILNAVKHPHVHILAHPTGRLVARPGNFFVGREGWSVDLPRIARACAAHHVAIEVNAFPERLDLSSESLRQVIDCGARIVIDSDAHSAYHLSLVSYGIQLARRAGCSEADILNTMAWEQISSYFRAKPLGTIDLARQHPSSDSPGSCASLVSSTECSFVDFFGSEKLPPVVGIDLTGSEIRESGWALLRGVECDTRRIAKDDDLFNMTMAENPSIVSIDSPLALPFGRCCTNSACKCRVQGITRFCERFLMANGIGVFPCLLPSMVGLTARGIKLRERFESAGVKVIESYPGAAQDILGMPRKKRGLDILCEALVRFGMNLGKQTGHISHDEVDAVTSALVAYFYLCGKFLELGDNRENYLVVPSVQSFKTTSQSKYVIALAGETGTGKTTSALYLALNYGFKYICYSNTISKLSSLAGPYDKMKLIEAGARLHEELGQKEITRRLISELPDHQYVVIDGVRFLDDLATLREHFGDRLLPIFLDAPRSLVARRLGKNPFFRQYSERQIDEMLAHPLESEVFALQFCIPDRIDNKGSFKELFRRINGLLRS